jgi:hypothetical protein
MRNPKATERGRELRGGAAASIFGSHPLVEIHKFPLVARRVSLVTFCRASQHEEAA